MSVGAVGNNLVTLKKWGKGQSGNPSGRPKGFLVVRRLFRRALVETTGRSNTLAEKIIAHAFNDDSPSQVEAWKIVLAYGIGGVPKSLDEDTVRRLAEELIAQRRAEVEAQLAAENAANAIDVEASSNRAISLDASIAIEPGAPPGGERAALLKEGADE